MINNMLDKFKEKELDDSVVHIKEAAERKGEYTEPYSIGYPIFDDALKGGVRAGNLIIITGKSGEGKTTLAQNIAVNLSKEILPSLFFSYEVIIDDLYAKFKEMGAEDEEFFLYTPKKNTSGQLKWVKEKIKEGLEKYHTKFVFIDHIDFLTPSKVENSDQHRIMLRNICQEFKSMAIELEIVIFLLAHVRKILYGKEIELQDVAESAGIYQNADFVFSIAREYAKQNIGGKKVEVVTDESIMKLLKNRITGG